MITIECDVCKSKYQSKGIFSKVINEIRVGGQREIKGFQELIPQLKTNGVCDVCESCMAQIVAKQGELAKTKSEGIFVDLKEFIRGGLNG